MLLSKYNLLIKREMSLIMLFMYVEVNTRRYGAANVRPCKAESWGEEKHR